MSKRLGRALAMSLLAVAAMGGPAAATGSGRTPPAIQFAASPHLMGCDVVVMDTLANYLNSRIRESPEATVDLSAGKFVLHGLSKPTDFVTVRGGVTAQFSGADDRAKCSATNLPKSPWLGALFRDGRRWSPPALKHPASALAAITASGEIGWEATFMNGVATISLMKPVVSKPGPVPTGARSDSGASGGRIDQQGGDETHPPLAAAQKATLFLLVCCGLLMIAIVGLLVRQIDGARRNLDELRQLLTQTDGVFTEQNKLRKVVGVLTTKSVEAASVEAANATFGRAAQPPATSAGRFTVLSAEELVNVAQQPPENTVYRGNTGELVREAPPIVSPGSNFLRGGQITHADWQRQARDSYKQALERDDNAVLYTAGWGKQLSEVLSNREELGLPLELDQYVYLQNPDGRRVLVAPRPKILTSQEASEVTFRNLVGTRLFAISRADVPRVSIETFPVVSIADRHGTIEAQGRATVGLN